MTDPPDPESPYRRAGIADGYIDAFGQWRDTPDATRAAILKALGVPVAGDQPDDDRMMSADPAFLPPAIVSGARLWGFPIQLYSLRSRRNWGMGDFTDLAAFVDRVADLGGDVVAVNPLHALFPGNPAHISPYAPSSRIFRNTLYLDIEAIPDFATCSEAQQTVGATTFQEDIRRLRAATLVDHIGVAAHKRPILERLYQHFRTDHLTDDGGARTERGAAFRHYQQAGGDALERYGVFEAIAERLGSDGGAPYYWRAWPVELRAPGSPDVASFAASHRSRVEFHHYLQWESDRQLAAVQARCRRRDMAIGLMHDLAVGFDSSGADAWIWQDFLCPGMAIGAPPDLLSPNGQDWGFPPFNPFTLREAKFAPFVETLRANMAHGGGLRIDHVLGFARQYWVPHGSSAADGGYVSFPMEALLSAIADESHRAGCLVVGEDLGTVPAGFRERLAEARLLSYRLAYFERDAAGGLPAPETFPWLALVATGTHDLPTLPGFWLDRDIDLRKELGFFATHDIEGELRAGRDRDRAAIWQAVTSDASTPPASVGPDLATALYTYLARTPSCLLMIHAEDLTGVEEQINLPGVTDGHPNWRRKMAVTVDDFAADARIATACATVDLARRAPAG